MFVADRQSVCRFGCRPGSLSVGHHAVSHLGRVHYPSCLESSEYVLLALDENPFPVRYLSLLSLTSSRLQVQCLLRSNVPFRPPPPLPSQLPRVSIPPSSFTFTCQPHFDTLSVLLLSVPAQKEKKEKENRHAKSHQLGAITAHLTSSRCLCTPPKREPLPSGNGKISAEKGTLLD